MSKACFKCGLIQPISDFYRHRMMADGHLNKCKTCTRMDVRDNRDTRLEYYRAYDRLRFYEHGSRGQATIAAKARGQRAYDDRNPEKRSAHRAVNNAVRDGRLTKAAACETCGKRGRLHGHHDDYSKLLEVRWLCSPCHSAWHRKYDEEDTRMIVERGRERKAG